MFNESERPQMDTSFEPTFSKQEPIIKNIKETRQSRSRERRSRGNRLSRDNMAHHLNEDNHNTHRETIDEIMMQIQSKPLPH